MSPSILITGCSSGIGLCAALTLQKRGYRVFATARQEQDVEKLKAMQLASLLLDVDRPESMQLAVEHVLSQTGGTLDMLFNNSGYVQAGAVEDLTRNMMRAQFETNVFGAIELTNLVLPIMRKQGHGRIIQNTSILGFVTMPYRGAYSASKFALEAFSQTLRHELHGTGIHVSMLVPGPIQTHLREKALEKYQHTLQHKPSVHQAVYEKMEKYFFAAAHQDRKLALSATKVMPALIRALESEHPKAHYYVGFPAHLFVWLRRLLPDAVMEWVIRRVLRGEIGEKNA